MRRAVCQHQLSFLHKFVHHRLNSKCPINTPSKISTNLTRLVSLHCEKKGQKVSDNAKYRSRIWRTAKCYALTTLQKTRVMSKSSTISRALAHFFTLVLHDSSDACWWWSSSDGGGGGGGVSHVVSLVSQVGPLANHNTVGGDPTANEQSGPS